MTGRGMSGLFLRSILGFMGMALAGCGSHQGEPSVAYSLDGPALFICGDFAGAPVKGSMERSVMVGVGAIRLEVQNQSAGYTCEGTLNSPPTEKGRVRGAMNCSDGQAIIFTLRNLGPDQGVAVGRSTTSPADLVLFYHSSAEEAARRFPAVQKDIEKARQTALNGEPSAGASANTENRANLEAAPSVKEYEYTPAEQVPERSKLEGVDMRGNRK